MTLPAAFTLWVLSLAASIVWNHPDLFIVAVYFFLIFSSVIAWYVTNQFKQNSAEIFPPARRKQSWLLVPNLRFISTELELILLGRSSGALNFFIGAASCGDGEASPSLGRAVLCRGCWLTQLGAGAPSALPASKTLQLSTRILPPCSLKQSGVAEDCPSAKHIFRQRSKLQVYAFLQLRLQPGN